jgi:transposase
MAVTIVGTNPDAVIGGVDTHAEVHVAAVVNHVGGVLGVESFPTTMNGYRQLVSWLASHGELTLVGVEGTGSYGVGVARYLARAGIDVVDVDRPNRQTRHRKGKSDPVDAVAAARAALSGTASGLPKTRDGNVEAIRVLMIARRSAIDTRIETLNQLRHVVFTATPEIRAKFTGLTAIGLTNTASALKPRTSDPDQVRQSWTAIPVRSPDEPPLHHGGHRPGPGRRVTVRVRIRALPTSNRLSPGWARACDPRGFLLD